MLHNLELMPLTVEGLEKCFHIKVKALEELFDAEVLKKAGMKQGIVYNYELLSFGDIGEVEIKSENIIEAKLFNDIAEIDIINGDKIHGSIAMEKLQSMIIEEKYMIYDQKYSELNVKKYMDKDKDGQVYISYVKPCEFTTGGEK